MGNLSLSHMPQRSGQRLWWQNLHFLPSKFCSFVRLHCPRSLEKWWFPRSDQSTLPHKHIWSSMHAYYFILIGDLANICLSTAPFPFSCDMWAEICRIEGGTCSYRWVIVWTPRNCIPQTAGLVLCLHLWGLKASPFLKVRLKLALCGRSSLSLQFIGKTIMELRLRPDIF